MLEGFILLQIQLARDIFVENKLRGVALGITIDQEHSFLKGQGEMSSDITG
jgi:hypothetical protein